jgi:hypothetical protein
MTTRRTIPAWNPDVEAALAVDPVVCGRGFS